MVRRLRSTRRARLVSSLLLGLAAACVSAERARAADPVVTGDRWAVLVGVDAYALAGPLQYCGADQRAFREHLVAAGFPQD